MHLVLALALAGGALGQKPAASNPRRLADFEFTDTTLKPAVMEWFEDRVAAENKYGAIGTWRTGRVTDMSELFCANDSGRGCSYYNSAAASFNEDISGWNTAAVTTFKRMFWSAYAFNQPIGKWETGAVLDMSTMFGSASSFNQPIGEWETGAVEEMSYMFFRASAFNQPIGEWETGALRSMPGMFQNASSFNQTLGWCTVKSLPPWSLDEAFLGAGCEATSCGVTDTCAPTASPSTAPTDQGGSDAACARAGVLFSLLAATAAWLLI